jgi:hypothetical protein
MTKYHYLDENNRPAGPLSLEEIRARAKAGSAPVNPLVAPEGASQWQALDSLPPQADFRLEQFLPNTVDALLRLARGALNPRFLTVSLDAARDVGHWGVIAAGVLAVVAAVVTSVKSGSVAPMGAGLGLVLVLVGAQYAASRFFSVNENLLKGSNACVSSPAVLDCAGLLALVGSVAVLVGALIICFQSWSWKPLVPAVLTAGFWTYFAAVALHPESVKIATGQAAPGEDAIGLTTFFLRAFLKLIPLNFFAMASFGALLAALSLFDLEESLFPLLRPLFAFVPFPRLLPLEGFVGSGMAVTACLLPLLGYLAFIVFSLPLEMWRVLLGLPARIDSLKR